MTITYEDIKRANEAIKTTDIKGKEYAEVNQRIKAFRMVYPEGFIQTGIISNEGGVCIIRASVGYYVDDGREVILGVGTAYEKEGSTFINKTSYIENCETSAVGRALGMAGFGIDTSVASAEEVQNAIANQDTPIEPTWTKCSQCGNVIKARGKWSAEQIADMNYQRFGRVLCADCGSAENKKQTGGEK